MDGGRLQARQAGRFAAARNPEGIPEYAWSSEVAEEGSGFHSPTPEVVERFKASGPGWQSRIDDVLKKAVGL